MFNSTNASILSSQTVTHSTLQALDESEGACRIKDEIGMPSVEYVTILDGRSLLRRAMLGASLAGVDMRGDDATTMGMRWLQSLLIHARLTSFLP